MLKAASIAVAVIVVLMPKIDNLALPEFGFPFVTTAIAAEAGNEDSPSP
jgi:hypothetical protein